MRVRLINFTLISLLTGSNLAAAQEICRDIISYASRDLSEEDRSDSVAYALYQEHCEGSQSKRANQTTIGLEAVVKQVPIKFNLGSGSAEERLSSFCRIFSQNAQASSQIYLRSSTVVRESLTAFNNCVYNASRGVYFTPSIQRTMISIDVRKGTEDARITGVHYDNNLLSCTVPYTDTSPTTSTADADTRKRLEAGSYSVTCHRKPQTLSDGTIEYPSVDISIGTDRAGFTLPVRADALLTSRWATDASARMGQLEGMLRRNLTASDQLRARVDIIEGRLGQIAWGSQSIGSSNIGGRGEIKLTVPLTRQYQSPPLVVITTSGNTADFVTSILTRVTPESFDVWAWRNNGGSFSAPVSLNWIEIGIPQGR